MILPMRPRSRKAVLTLHIVSAGAWIGVDVVVACLVLIGRTGDDRGTRALAYQALAEFVVAPMLLAALICLVTGVLLGVATKWGLVRYWWVLVKLVMNIVLCALILLVLRPGMGEVRAHGEALATGLPAAGDVSSLVYPPTVSLTALTIAVLLSVYKPWGRIAARRSRRTER